MAAAVAVAIVAAEGVTTAVAAMGVTPTAVMAVAAAAAAAAAVGGGAAAAAAAAAAVGGGAAVVAAVVGACGSAVWPFVDRYPSSWHFGLACRRPSQKSMRRPTRTRSCPRTSWPRFRRVSGLAHSTPHSITHLCASLRLRALFKRGHDVDDFRCLALGRNLYLRCSLLDLGLE